MKYNPLTAKINSYFAVLLITIAGAGASMIIVHVAYDNAFDLMIVSSDANFVLHKSLLKH